MSGNAQKTPLVGSLNKWADDKDESFNQLQGKALPCSVVEVGPSGTTVTIKFEIQDDVITIPQVTVPVFGPKYMRYPLQVGDKGYALPSDFYMGGMTGIGGGTASLEQQGNLSNLVFFPVGNIDNEDTPDPNKSWVNGPDGVLVTNEDQTVSLDVGYEKGGVFVDAPLGGNIFGATLTVAADDDEAKGKGIPKFGFYQDPDGFVHCQRLD